MSERSYTPGPWRYDSGFFYAECQLDKNGMTYERPIAEILEGRPLNAKANARLIAAAPEMFELLVDIDSRIGEITEEAWAKLQEIIKRVRGEE